MIGRWERRLTLTGAGLGLALVAVGFLLGLASVARGGDNYWHRNPLLISWAALAAAPYALAIIASRIARTRSEVRAAMLLAALLPAGTAAVVSVLVLLPSFALLAGAAMIATRQTWRMPPLQLLLPALAGVTITAAWFASFLSLSATLDPRCWTFDDGSRGCGGNIVTLPEALAALALLAVAGAAAALVLWQRSGSSRHASAAL